MPKYVAGGLALALLALWLLTACQSSEAQPDEATVPQDPNYVIGAGLYKRHCAGCHGEAGEGRTSLGPKISGAEWQQSVTDDDIRTMILEGRRVAGTSMEGYRDVLSDDEITAVITYVRGFGD